MRCSQSHWAGKHKRGSAAALSLGRCGLSTGRSSKRASVVCCIRAGDDLCLLLP